MNNNSINKLSSYVEALRPIVYIPTFDFNAFDTLLSTIQGEAKIYEFNDGLGYVNFKSKQPETDYSLEEFLSFFITSQSQSTFIVLKDIHHHLNTPKVMSLLKSIALRNIYNDNFYTTIFIVSTKLTIPIELEKLITIFETPFPEINEIESIVKIFASDMDITIDESLVDELSLSLKGFSEFEIIQILNLAYQNSGSIEKKDAKLILIEKEQIIKKSRMIEILNFEGNIDDIGGLEN